jgi:hypothetical protein
LVTKKTIKITPIALRRVSSGFPHNDHLAWPFKCGQGGDSEELALLASHHHDYDNQQQQQDNAGADGGEDDNDPTKMAWNEWRCVADTFLAIPGPRFNVSKEPPSKFKNECCRRLFHLIAVPVNDFLLFFFFFFFVLIVLILLSFKGFSQFVSRSQRLLRCLRAGPFVCGRRAGERERRRHRRQGTHDAKRHGEINKLKKILEEDWYQELELKLIPAHKAQT